MNTKALSLYADTAVLPTIAILSYRPLLKKRLEKISQEGIFRRLYYCHSKRSFETMLILNLIELRISRLLKILASTNYLDLMIEENRKLSEKVKRNYYKLKKLKIEEKEFREFKEKLEKINDVLKRMKELQPLSEYLSFVLDLYPELIKLDHKMIKELKKEEYLNLLEKSLVFPEKLMLFEAPIIALYLVFGGYKRLTLMQLARLTSSYHKIYHLLNPFTAGIAKLGKRDVIKLAMLAER